MPPVSAAQGVTPQELTNLASACTLPATGSSFSYSQSKALSQRNRHSPHAEEGVRPLWLRGRRGTKASDPSPPHIDPSPISAHRSRGTLGDRPRRAAAECAIKRHTISPSSSPPHCACAARAPAEPLHGSLFDSSHPGASAPPPRAHAGRSAQGLGAGPGRGASGPPFTCRIFDVGESHRPP